MIDNMPLKGAFYKYGERDAIVKQYKSDEDIHYIAFHGKEYVSRNLTTVLVDEQPKRQVYPIVLCEYNLIAPVYDADQEIVHETPMGRLYVYYNHIYNYLWVNKDKYYGNLPVVFSLKTENLITIDKEDHTTVFLKKDENKSHAFSWDVSLTFFPKDGEIGKLFHSGYPIHDEHMPLRPEDYLSVDISVSAFKQDSQKYSSESSYANIIHAQGETVEVEMDILRDPMKFGYVR